MRKVLFMLLAVTVITLLPTNIVDAKTIMVNERQLNESFLEKHKEDDIYVYFYGITTDKYGNGKVIYGIPGYVTYKHLNCNRRGVRITTIMKMRKGAVYVDDHIDRIDYFGWKRPAVRR